MTSTAKETKAWERRWQVSDYYLQGKTQTSIAELFGVSQKTISNDIKAIRKQWIASSLRDFDELKAQELAKIDALERTYWASWEASLGESKSTTTTASDINLDTQTPKSLHRISRTIQGFGDPRFLQGVQWCIDKRCKIFGFDAPVKVQVSWRQELLDLWKSGNLTAEDIVDELGNDIAQEFFESAGIHFAGIGELEPQSTRALTVQHTNQT